MPVGAGRLGVADRALERVGRAARELVEPDQREVGARDHRPAHQRQVELAADDLDVEVVLALAADREHDLLALGAADAADGLVDRLALGGQPVDGLDLVAAVQVGLLGRGVREDARDDDRPVLALADLDADAHERARQRAVGGLGLLRGHERRVALVADGLGERADRRVRHVGVVEAVGVDVVVVDRAPRLLDEADVGGRAAGPRGRGAGLERPFAERPAGSCRRPRRRRTSRSRGPGRGPRPAHPGTLPPPNPPARRPGDGAGGGSGAASAAGLAAGVGAAPIRVGVPDQDGVWVGWTGGAALASSGRGDVGSVIVSFVRACAEAWSAASSMTYVVSGRVDVG